MFSTLLLERRRARAVRSLHLLGTPAHPQFDRFVNEAAAAFDAPFALLSLIHGDDQWFKASHGMDLTCLPRRQSFCTWVLDSDGTLESCDPEGDPRFADLPVVTGEPFVRYYLGAPLRLFSDMDVGALCIGDTVRRPPASPDQRAYLLGLARRASAALEVHVDSVRTGVAA